MSPVLLISSALAARTHWPDLSRPPQIGGGEQDAALIVVVEDYAFVSDITGARDNALDWYAWLTEGRGVRPGRVKVLTDGQATRESVTAAAEQLSAIASPGGTLWFIFIGHGAPSSDGRDGVLLGFDVQQTARSVAARGVPQSELLEVLAASRAGSTVAVLDACFSGLSSDGEALVDGLQPLVPTGVLNRHGVTVLSAGGSQEFAGPLPGADRPAFSYLALGALQGWGDADEDGVVTAGEAIDYTREVLQALPIGRSQVPELVGQTGLVLGGGDRTAPELSRVQRSLVPDSQRSNELVPEASSEEVFRWGPPQATRWSWGMQAGGLFEDTERDVTVTTYFDRDGQQLRQRVVDEVDGYGTFWMSGGAIYTFNPFLRGEGWAALYLGQQQLYSSAYFDEGNGISGYVDSDGGDVNRNIPNAQFQPRLSATIPELSWLHLTTGLSLEVMWGMPGGTITVPDGTYTEGYGSDEVNYAYEGGDFSYDRTWARFLGDVLVGGEVLPVTYRGTMLTLNYLVWIPVLSEVTVGNRAPRYGGARYTFSAGIRRAL